MLLSEISSFQILLGIVIFVFLMYYVFLKNFSKPTISTFNLGERPEDVVHPNRKLKFKSSGFEIDKMSSFHRSYNDIKKGLDIYSYSNLLSKTYKKMPREIIFLMDNVKVFGHFDEGILLSLFPYMETKTLLSGEHLHDNCDPNNNIIVIQSGKIEVFVNMDENHLHRIKVAHQVVYLVSLVLK